MIDPRAVEAAYTAMGEFQYGNTYDPNKTAHQTGWSYDQLLAGLEAAAPILQAAVLRDIAQDFGIYNNVEIYPVELEYREEAVAVRAHLHARADELERKDVR